MSQFKTFTGTPIFLQGQNTPTQNEAINIASFNEGGLTFFYARAAAEIYLLTAVDINGNQTWVLFPGNVDNISYIAVLPVLQKLYWFTSESDSPTSEEPIPEILTSDNTYGLLWWNRQSGFIFKLTDYDIGTQQQTWTQIV